MKHKVVIKISKEFFLFLFVCLVSPSFAQFTAGNLVVLQVGDSVTALSNNAVRVSLIEMTTAGTLTGNNVNMRTVTSGANRKLTQSGTASSEGEVTLSANGKYLVCVGYDASPGSTTAISSTATVGVIARIDATGTVNSNTPVLRAATTASAYSGNNFRSACTIDGSFFWGSGAGNTISGVGTGGVHYFTYSVAGGGVRVDSINTNTRIINAFYNVTTGNNRIYVSSAAAATYRIGTLGGSPPPTTVGSAVTATLPSSFPTSTTDPYSFVLFDTDFDGVYDVIYFADFNDGTSAGVYKYSFDGTNWTARGKILNSSSNTYARGITGQINCNGSISLYFTTAASTFGRPNKVWAYTDNASFNSNMTSNGGDINSVATNIRSVPNANCAYGGICFAPQSVSDLLVNVTSGNTTTGGSFRNISVLSGYTLTLNANTSVTGVVYVASGATLDCGSYNITGTRFILASGATLKIGSPQGITAASASGNIQTSCRSYSSGANYEYKGTAAQVTGDGLPATVNKLTINQTVILPGVTLTNPVSVTSQLTLTNGVLYTTTTNMLTMLAGSSATSCACNNSYVDGPITKVGNTAFTFPTGNNGYYAPVGISAPTLITDAFVGQYYNADPDPTYNMASKDPFIDHISQCEYWTINRTSGTSSVNVTLTWDTPRSCVVNSVPDLLMTQWDGSAWQLDLGDLGTPTGTNTSGSISSNYPYTSFSNSMPFTLGSDDASVNPLPIELLNFNANYNGICVNLDWSTASELNNDYFNVERSSDGVEFNSISKVKGAGNSSNTINYKDMDKNPLSGTSYYRLKQTDYNGKTSYSGIRMVTITDDLRVEGVYPNPFNEVLSIDFNKIPMLLSIKITNSVGVVVYESNVSNNKSVRLDLPELLAGVYFIEIRNDNYAYHTKVIKN